MLVALKQRANAYDTVSKRFGFLKNLQSLSNDGMRDHVSFVCETYFEDVEPNCNGEFIHFTSLFAKLSPPNETDCVELQMYTFLVKNSLTDTFVNVYTVLRIYLSLMVTNCTGERSFSVLKRVKNELRSTMGQPRLNDLALLCIESDIVRSRDFTVVIKKFASKKARKVNI